MSEDIFRELDTYKEYFIYKSPVDISIAIGCDARSWEDEDTQTLCLSQEQLKQLIADLQTFVED